MADDVFDGRADLHRAPANLPRLSVPKASDVLADELRRQIFSGELAETLPLPVERELAASTGLSRGSVREALRLLELEGLISTRPGRSGGSFVRRPDASTFERSLGVLVGGKGVKFQTLVEAREALEPAVGALAAENRTDVDLEAIEAASARLTTSLEDMSDYRQLNLDWHLAVVDATHNEIMKAFVGSLWRAILYADKSTHIHSDETLRLTVVAHKRILAAIRKGDPRAASRAMARHAQTYRAEVQRFDLADEVVLTPTG